MRKFEELEKNLAMKRRKWLLILRCLLSVCIVW